MRDRPSLRRLSLVLFFVAPLLAAPLGCGARQSPVLAAPEKTLSQRVFEFAAPSVVAVLNDDRADREKDILDLQKALGDETHAPKRVIDVSLRKEPTPHGTGFMIPGGLIATAAHVVLRPDRLKLSTRAGQTVDAELVRIDEVRDVAILRPKQPLVGIRPLEYAETEPEVGEKVWAMGHTGHGYWALSWGMSEGIASGTVEMFGAKLLLFDAAVYPGFSGGPVLTMSRDGNPKIIGVNHAILFTGGGDFPIGPISSAVSLSELEEVAAGRPPAVEAILAEYAKRQRQRRYADLFVTDRLSITRDAHDQQIAHIMGHAGRIEVTEENARVPVVAMLFNLPKGDHEVLFELHDSHGATLVTETARARVGEKQRLTFASAAMRFKPKHHGRFAAVAKFEGKEIGRTFVNLELDDDDDELADHHDGDSAEDGDPDIDIVVAQGGRDNPLMLMGITSGWAERSYPRRVNYTWFARGTRGWSGTNVSITSFVLDEDGHIVGRSDGCLTQELRPERTWSCVHSGGMAPPPMARREGHYDIVFAINNRPVAWWPMEANLRQEHAPGSDIERWMKDMKRVIVKRKKEQTAPPPPPPAPPAPTPPARAPQPKVAPKAPPF